MQITTKEVSLEELNNNVVEYVLKSPHNTNPAILRQMLNSRGVSSGSDLKKNIVFSISNSTNDNLDFVDVFTGEIITPEQLAKITLSGTGFYATTNSYGIPINGEKYALGSILGFAISSTDKIAMIVNGPTSVNQVYVYGEDYVQSYLNALIQELANA